MKHINSIYLYCDASLFLEFPLPTVDSRIYSNQIRPSDYQFEMFRNYVQVKNVPAKSNQGLAMNDVVVAIDGDTKDVSVERLSTTNTTNISYHKRPFGVPNLIPADERGWLFAERITIAIKIVASSKDRFSDIVLSNSDKLRDEIFVLSDILGDGLKRHEHEKSMKEYMKILETKKFSFGTDVELVRDIVRRLVDKFAKKAAWKEEQTRQKKIGRRAREILLRWGSFSQHYIEKSRMIALENEDEIDDDTNVIIFQFLCIAIFPPLIALLLFVLPWYPSDPLDTGPIIFFWNNIRPATIMVTLAVGILHSIN